MKYKYFFIRSLNLFLILLLLIGYQAVIISRQKQETIVELESKVHKLESEKEYILETLKEEGISEKEEASDGSYKDGEYNGTGEGFGGNISVCVRISGQKIEEITVINADGEDEAYLSMAKKVINQIIEKQSGDVDTISGATYSSTGIITAVKDALKGATK